MITVFSVIALIFALSGNLLINFKKKIGYPVWIISNIAWIIVNVIGTMNIPQIIMYVVYVGLNIHGFISWNRKENENDRV